MTQGHRTITTNSNTIGPRSPTGSPAPWPTGPWDSHQGHRGMAPHPLPRASGRGQAGQAGHAGAGTRHPVPGPLSLCHCTMTHWPCPLCLLTSTAVRWTETSRSIG